MRQTHHFWTMKLWTGVAIWILLLTWGLRSNNANAAADGEGEKRRVDADDGDGDAWDATMQSLDLLDGEAFKSVAYPLVQIAGNAYRYPAVIPIPGWTLVDAVAPIHGGMHAVLYEEEEKNENPISKFGSGLRSGRNWNWNRNWNQIWNWNWNRNWVRNRVRNRRMILSFRGTDLSGDEASLADVCADAVLWNDTEITGDVDCFQQFSPDTIDYYTQAVDYTRKVLEAHPQASLLLSGHSLGAGLAILVSATIATATASATAAMGSPPHHPLRLPVIAFSSAGTRNQLLERSLHLAGDHEKKLFVVADKWDEIMRSKWDTQVGILCLYETRISEDCTECFEEELVSSRSRAMAMGETGSSTSPLLLWAQRHQESDGGRIFGTDGTIASLQKGSHELLEINLGKRWDSQDGHIRGPETSLPCLNCFFQTHYLRHVIDLVEVGSKPVCKPRSLWSQNA